MFVVRMRIMPALVQMATVINQTRRRLRKDLGRPWVFGHVQASLSTRAILRMWTMETRHLRHQRIRLIYRRFRQMCGRL